jgi:glutathione S-transferase
MRTLYHYPHSPFSRRVRLALAHKGLAYEARDGRANPAYAEEGRKLWPLRTMPVLVEDDGRVIGDSTAISRYLDAAYPAGGSLWPGATDPEGARVTLEVTALVDGALNLLVDLGTRYHPLKGDPAWSSVKDELQGRAQAALDALAARVSALGERPLSPPRWSAAEIWLLTAVLWLDGLPARAAGNPNVTQLLSLGWNLPAPLLRWAEPLRAREDVRALD